MSVRAATAMAKKKKATEAGKTGKSRDEWSRKPLILQMRGSEEWKAWLDEVAEFSRSTVANFVDQAIAEKARGIGFPKLPPKR